MEFLARNHRTAVHHSRTSIELDVLAGVQTARVETAGAVVVKAPLVDRNAAIVVIGGRRVDVEIASIDGYGTVVVEIVVGRKTVRKSQTAPVLDKVRGRVHATAVLNGHHGSTGDFDRTVLVEGPRGNGGIAANPNLGVAHIERPVKGSGDAIGFVGFALVRVELQIQRAHMVVVGGFATAVAIGAVGGVHRKSGDEQRGGGKECLHGVEML